MLDIITQNRKLILILIIVLIAWTILKRLFEWPIDWTITIIPWINNYKYKYRIKQYFFSYAEKEFYTNLKKILYNNYWFKYEIFPKVRLADIFEPEKWDKWWKRLAPRHVDFLIVDKDQAFKPMLAIELDGDSHKQYRQYKSDNFKNQVFKDNNLPLIRFNNSTSNNEQIIKINITQYLWNSTKEND